MWRYLIGVFAGAALAVGGVLLWKGGANAERTVAPAARTASATAATDPALPEPPVASEKTREQRRFGRYDKDKDGAVAREEYLASRRKAYAKLDANGDGRLTFDEWAVKTEQKFAGADADRNGALTPVEFATTRVVRKSRPKVACPPAAAEAEDA